MGEQAWENVQGTKEKSQELLRAMAMGDEWGEGKKWHFLSWCLLQGWALLCILYVS